ncbi:hypothetical protein BB559_003043 [Furculomyces boomerangus]|uniref:Rad60/SUMO-like domain-containing protein n=2 Tax=Harpellales TaxID=61421 RepID=A0A2T9YPH2_9FUNG|nr:hypothetical protein BB559_003043 [Furculomyces boomerangus]PWA00706.1 hypothetical protein BB558_003239 [Smittium angustum]
MESEDSETDISTLNFAKKIVQPREIHLSKTTIITPKPKLKILPKSYKAPDKFKKPVISISSTKSNPKSKYIRDLDSDSSDDAFFSREISSEQKSKLIKQVSIDTKKYQSIELKNSSVFVDTIKSDSDSSISENVRSSPKSEKRIQSFTSESDSDFSSSSDHHKQQSKKIRNSDNYIGSGNQFSNGEILKNDSLNESSSDCGYTDDDSISIETDRAKATSRIPLFFGGMNNFYTPHPNPFIENDTEAVYEGLDPALMEVVKSHKKHQKYKLSGSTIKNENSLKSKLDTENQLPSIINLDEDENESINLILNLKLDTNFLNDEIKNTSAFHWNKESLVFNNDFDFEKMESLKITMASNDTFLKTLETLRLQLMIPFDTSRLVLVYDNVKVYPTVTPRAISTSETIEMDVYPTNVYNRFVKKQKNNFEQVISDPPTLADMTLESDDLDLNVDSEALDAIKANKTTEETFKIKIRSKLGKDIYMDIAKSVKISFVIEAYKKACELGNEVKVKLSFDDESLNPNDKIGDTEIEDDDMIMASF